MDNKWQKELIIERCEFYLAHILATMHLEQEESEAIETHNKIYHLIKLIRQELRGI